AVARPILRERIARKETKETTVYIGVRSPRDVPLASEVAGWMHAGAKLVLCLSVDPETAAPESSRVGLSDAVHANGWVQHVLQADFDAGKLARGSLVFGAGPKDMLAHLRAMPEKAEKNGSAGPVLEVITNA